MEILSLKALSEKVLQRNRQRNLKETSSFHAGKPAAEKFPILGRKTDVLLEPGTISLPATLGDFQSLFEETVAEVGACYLPGTLEMIREDFPDLAGEIDQAEDEINELWLKAGKGPVDVGAFREAVDRWKRLHLKGINLFLKIDGRGNFNG